MIPRQVYDSSKSYKQYFIRKFTQGKTYSNSLFLSTGNEYTNRKGTIQLILLDSLFCISLSYRHP